MAIATRGQCTVWVQFIYFTVMFRKCKLISNQKNYHFHTGYKWRRKIPRKFVFNRETKQKQAANTLTMYAFTHWL